MSCWLRQFDDRECDGRLENAHIIPKARLKKAGLSKEEIWDRRVIVLACRRHHHSWDMKFLRLKRADLPEAVERYAADHNLEWSLERDYGPA